MRIKRSETNVIKKTDNLAMIRILIADDDFQLLLTYVCKSCVVYVYKSYVVAYDWKSSVAGAS